MAERIVSPGVFTREKDLSFLPQGISEIGAALIGPTQKAQHSHQHKSVILVSLKRYLEVLTLVFMSLTRLNNT